MRSEASGSRTSTVTEEEAGINPILVILVISIQSTSRRILPRLFRLSASATVYSALSFAQKADSVRVMQQSIAKQRQAIGKQAAPHADDGFFTVGWIGLPPLPAFPAADCAPLAETEVEPLIASAAKPRQLDPALLRAIIRQESGFRACAISPKGAMGLMQLMPETAEQFHVKDPFNAAENIGAGAQYVKQLLDRFKGDLKSALAAYNAGPERSREDAQQVPETLDYVSRILAALSQK
jgi:Transglycosylase SLT domain